MQLCFYLKKETGNKYLSIGKCLNYSTSIFWNIMWRLKEWGRPICTSRRISKCIGTSIYVITKEAGCTIIHILFIYILKTDHTHKTICVHIHTEMHGKRNGYLWRRNWEGEIRKDQENFYL